MISNICTPRNQTAAAHRQKKNHNMLCRFSPHALVFVLLGPRTTAMHTDVWLQTVFERRHELWTKGCGEMARRAFPSDKQDLVLIFQKGSAHGTSNRSEQHSPSGHAPTLTEVSTRALSSNLTASWPLHVSGAAHGVLNQLESCPTSHDSPRALKPSPGEHARFDRWRYRGA